MRVFKPKGVELTDPEDFDTQRQQIFDKVHDAVKNSFPRAFGGVRMELQDSEYEGQDNYTPAEQKDALLNNKYLTRKLRGTVNLYDDKTNDLLDTQKLTLMQVPWLSQRGTFTHRGNNYTSIRQLRLVPGPYGRIMDNGNMEVHFNVKPGSGPGYRVMLEPNTAQFKLKVGAQSEVHLYSVLKDMGIPDDHLKQSWGEGTWQRNSQKYNPRAFGQAYSKLVPPREQLPDAPMADKIKQLQGAFDRSQILTSVRDQHLPFSTDSVKQAKLQRELALTDREDDNLDHAFKPDLKPEQLTDVKNAIYGKAGPQLASMKQWPDAWVNKDVDPLGWLEWYDNYAVGRRSDDDNRQIQRWLRFKRRNGAAFLKSPSARGAFALRNWAIDPVKMLPEEDRETMEKNMEQYKSKAWADWAQKKAALTHADLQAMALHLNECSQAGIPLDGTINELEQYISQFLTQSPGTPQGSNQAMLSASNVFKSAALAHLIVRNQDQFDLAVDEYGAVQVKHANQSWHPVAEPEILMEVLGCLT